MAPVRQTACCSVSAGRSVAALACINTHTLAVVGRLPGRANAHIVKGKRSPLPVHLNFQMKNVILRARRGRHSAGLRSMECTERRPRDAGCRRHQRERQRAAEDESTIRVSTRKQRTVHHPQKYLFGVCRPNNSTRYYLSGARVRAATKSKQSAPRLQCSSKKSAPRLRCSSFRVSQSDIYAHISIFFYVANKERWWDASRRANR
jgi:hypothetical protein